MSAQLVIAREYGFAGWADLKRYVEGRHTPGGRYHYTEVPLSPPLIAATANGAIGEMKRLLAEDPARISEKGQLEMFYPGEFQPIHVWAGRSAAPGLAEMLNVLLDHGADVDATTENGWTPLLFALDSSGAKVDMLIDHGATIDVLAAAHIGDEQRLRELLQKDPTLANKRGGNGETALHRATTVEVARTLLEFGADPEAMVEGSASPEICLQKAVAEDRPDVARFLLAGGARADISR